ncbi:MAG TPA: crossover junction endodeoxyribonuclease RuvC [Sphingobacterium sp.]|nr:crossover junction endodeoxyribonuclease RuvC [Sphingobacterium sp.]
MSQQKAKERVILGIDPGTHIMGYGVIKENGSKISLVTMGIIKLNHLDSHALKLKKIFEKTNALMEEYLPDCVSLEAPFYGKNIQVMLKLGRAQGVAMAAALNKDTPIFEYAPRKIKQAVTGNGNATKQQVASMLQNLLKFKEKPGFLDATDGLAAAVCHSFQKSTLSGSSKSYSGWEAFIKDNKNRVR